MHFQHFDSSMHGSSRDVCKTSLIGDERTSIAALVNPRENLQEYWAAAQARGLLIRYVFLPDSETARERLNNSLFRRLRKDAKIYVIDNAEEDAGTDDWLRLRIDDAFEFGAVRLRMTKPKCDRACLSMEIYDLDTCAKCPQFVMGAESME